MKCRTIHAFSYAIKNGIIKTNTGNDEQNQLTKKLEDLQAR